MSNTMQFKSYINVYMSLIGNHDAFTSWSPTVVLPTQTYDNTQEVPFVAPQAPIVVTNPDTNVGTVLDSEFIEQIVRRNQENIYDSTKQQHIGIVKADTLLIKTNGTGVNEEWKDLWDEIVNHSAHIIAGIQSATAQDATLAIHTTDLTAKAAVINLHETSINNHTTDIAGLATAVNSNYDDTVTNAQTITTNTATLNSRIDGVVDDLDNGINPWLNGNTADITELKRLTSTLAYNNTTDPTNTWLGIQPHNLHLDTNTYINSLFYKLDGVNWSDVSGHFQKVLENETQLGTHFNLIADNITDIHQNTLSINGFSSQITSLQNTIVTQVNNQIGSFTVNSDDTIIRDSIDARLDKYGFDTELEVRAEFYGVNVGVQFLNVKGHIRKGVNHTVFGSSIIHNDITFLVKEAGYYKMTRYYWNPQTQQAVIAAAGSSHDSLPRLRYFLDNTTYPALPIGSITTIDDLTAELVDSNFWSVDHQSEAYITNAYSHIVYHVKNPVYTEPGDVVKGDWKMGGKVVFESNNQALSKYDKQIQFKDGVSAMGEYSNVTSIKNNIGALAGSSLTQFYGKTLFSKWGADTISTNNDQRDQVDFGYDKTVSFHNNSSFSQMEDFEYFVEVGIEINMTVNIIPADVNGFTSRAGTGVNGLNILTEILAPAGITFTYQGGQNPYLLLANQTEPLNNGYWRITYVGSTALLPFVLVRVVDVRPTIIKEGIITTKDIYIHSRDVNNRNAVYRAVSWEDIPKLVADMTIVDSVTNKVAENTIIRFNDDAHGKGSPAPFCYVDEGGRVGTGRLFDAIFNDQIFGVEDPDVTSANRKSNQYLQGLVPSAETVTDRTTKYLRADGSWGVVSIADSLSSGDLNIIKWKPDGTNIISLTDIYYDVDNLKNAPVVDATKVGNLNIFKGGTDHTFLYHGNNNFEDGIRFGAGGFFQLSSGGNSSTAAQMTFNVGGLTFATMTQTTNETKFIKAVEFAADVFWSPDGTNKESLYNLYTDVANIPTNHYTKAATDNLISQFDTSAEVDAKISAIPGPDLTNYYTKTGTDNLISQFDTSAEVDAKISAITTTPDIKLSDIHREVYNTTTGQVMWSLGSLGYISMPDTHFAGSLFWTPTGQGLTNLNVMNDSVNTLMTQMTDIPDFDTITSANKFCVTNTANGGTISYITPTTSNFNEGSNLYYTDDRVNARVTAALQNGEIANVVTQQLQAQTLVANSDIRLKKNICKVADGTLPALEPVSYVFKNDTTERTRYGFIAQDVEEIIPELVHTNSEGIKGINYQDIIALLVKDNQELRKKYDELNDRMKLVEICCKYR